MASGARRWSGVTHEPAVAQIPMNDTSQRPPAIPRLKDALLAMRPSQWTKNGVVLAAFFFAFWDRSQGLRFEHGLLVGLAAAGLFCLVSSGVYLLNDVRDVNEDRVHPSKRLRPVAAGRVSPGFAVSLAVALLFGGLFGAWRLSHGFAGVVGAYVLLQILYSYALKRVALVDVFVIAIGFVLRAIAGALALHVAISPWLLQCTFLLALFLALCKRRHEKLFVDGQAGGESRASLAQYDPRLLDMLIGISASATVVCYAIYTLAETTVDKFGTNRLGLTVPFVVFGVFRYLDLAYRHAKGDRPEMILLSDVPTLVNLALYGLTLLGIFLTLG